MDGYLTWVIMEGSDALLTGSAHISTRSYRNNKVLAVPSISDLPEIVVRFLSCIPNELEVSTRSPIFTLSSGVIVTYTKYWKWMEPYHPTTFVPLALLGPDRLTARFEAVTLWRR